MVKGKLLPWKGSMTSIADTPLLAIQLVEILICFIRLLLPLLCLCYPLRVGALGDVALYGDFVAYAILRPQVSQVCLVQPQLDNVRGILARLDPYPLPALHLGYYATGGATRKWIKHNISLVTGRSDYALQQG